MGVKSALFFSLALTMGVLYLSTHTQAKAQDIVVIKSHDIEPFNQALAGFVSACNQTITEYDLGGSAKGSKKILKSIQAGKPKLILALGLLAAQVAQEQVRDIPVVFFMVPNPYKYGLKGANMAGISLDIPADQQFAVYKTLVPSLHTLGVIYDPEKTGPMVTQADAMAAQAGLKLLASPVTSYKDVPAALRNMIGKIDALWMVPDDTVMTPDSFKFLLVEAFENNLPFLTISDIFVEVGALASLTPDYADLGRQGCQLAQAIASGRLSLTEVNVVPPAKINLAINLKTASKIGLQLPSEIVQSAAKVYR